jgi:hypothetical protein
VPQSSRQRATCQHVWLSTAAAAAHLLRADELNIVLVQAAYDAHPCLGVRGALAVD